MNGNTNINNRIFIHALTGSLLFVIAVVFTLLNLSQITTQLSYTAVASLLGVASLSLLFKAIKEDKNNERQMI